MIAQAYTDGTMRLFDRYGAMICDMVINPPLEDVADKQLKRLKIRRVGRWSHFQFGSQAKIRFI